MTFSETQFMFSRHRRFYEITGKYFVCSDRWIWDKCGWDSTSPTNCTTYLTRSICLSNMKIFLKVVDTQQVYLESDIQHLPMSHSWAIACYHITFISLNDGSRESIVVFVKIFCFVFFFMYNALSLWILYVTLTGTFWNFQVDFSPCANIDDCLSSPGQHFLLNEFQD